MCSGGTCQSRFLIYYIVPCPSPASEGAHTCLHLLCRAGTTPSISSICRRISLFCSFSPVIYVISSTCRRVVLRNDVFLSFVYFCLCFFDFFDLSTSRLPFLVYEKILASRLRRCDLCPCRSVLIFLFFLHSLCLSILTFLLLILCRRCPSNICR